MPHRQDDQHHIREARQTIGDRKITQTENALTAVARGTYKRARIETTAPEGVTWARNTPAVIHADLKRHAVTPLALTIPCVHAPVGAYCFGSGAVRGVCGMRVSKALLSRALAR